jgi:plastocyanin
MRSCFVSLLSRIYNGSTFEALPVIDADNRKRSIPMKKILAFCLICVFIFSLAGCGGSPSQPSPQNTAVSSNAPASNSASNSAPVSPSASASSSAPASNLTVTMGNRKFLPAELTVNKGDTVVWMNTDTIAHNVVGDKFFSSSLDHFFRCVHRGLVQAVAA